MRAHAKGVVMWLFGSRLVICVVDIGRMYIIHQALQSEDQTRKSFYPPPIFPKNFPIPVITTITKPHQLTPHPLSGSNLLWAILDQLAIHLSLTHATLPRIQTFLSALQIGPITVQLPGTQSKQLTTARSISNRAWYPLSDRPSSISEQPLREQQEREGGGGIELSTIVYTGKEGGGERGREGAESVSSEGEGNTGRQGGVRVQKDISVTYDYM
jgi:hypothetical protein